jgi:hypothetical protein
MDASDDADVLDAPGAECSARMVVPWAMQELQDGLPLAISSS